MIHANELMIGNWVQVTDACTGKSIPCKITRIWENEYVALDGDIDATDLPTDLLAPIPITPEILEKNGFCQFWNEDVMLMTRDDVDLEVGNNYKTFEDGRVYLKGIKMYYVHQLQNVLRLCGIEKTIEL